MKQKTTHPYVSCEFIDVYPPCNHKSVSTGVNQNVLNH